MFNRFLKSFLLVSFILSSALSMPNFIFGQDEEMENKCLILTEKGCQNQDANQCKKSLEDCEKYYSNESDRINGDIQKTTQEKKTLNSKISTLSQKIKELNYRISQSNLVIKDLKFQITDTEDSIGQNINKIEDLKIKLSSILRTLDQEDQKPLIEILMSEQDLSGFFDSLLALEILNSKNKDILKDIKLLKTSLEEQKVSLDGDKTDLEATVKMHELQKQENSKTKKDQEYYLSITEKEYQQQVQEKKATEQKVAKIRARIFELAGGDTKAPTFGEAYEIAKYVNSVTGVRPALILAVLQQESAIGKNVGQCYLKNSSTGAGVKINGAALSRVMNPTRDVPVFLVIANESGRDPYNTPVSCPMSFGWGGAMGPGQFIPATWKIYKGRVASLTGRAADPWNIRDAFIATGLYLSDYGAANQTYNSEWKAAMIYFSGSTNSKYSFYGNQVMAKAADFQEDINAIEALK